MNKSRRSKRTAVEDENGIRRWIVLTGSFVTIFQFCSILFGQGIFYLLLLERFGEGEARTSLVGAVYSAVFAFSGVLASAFINVSSCRVTSITGSILHVIGLALSAFVPSLDLTILTLGVLAGLGHSFSNGASICVIGFYFRKKRATFMSLSFVVVGFAMMTATPFLLYLSTVFTYQELCLILASINAQTCVYSMFAKPSALEKESTRRQESTSKQTMCITKLFHRVKSAFDVSLLFNLGYVCFLLTLTTWNFGLMAVTVHLPNYMAIHGGSEADIAALMVSFSLANTVGRFSGSLLVNRFNNHMLRAQNVGLAISGLVTASFPLYALLPGGSYIFSIQLGFFVGIPNTMMTPLSNSFVEPAKIAESYGFTYIFCGFGMAIGPAVAGLLYSWTTTYSNSFVLAGIMLLIGSVLGICSRWCQTSGTPVVTSYEIKIEEEHGALLSGRKTEHVKPDDTVKTQAKDETPMLNGDSSFMETC